MMARTRDEIQKHNRVLLHCLQKAHPVLHNGVHRFIHTLTFSSGSEVETTVYLAGHGEVPAEELSPSTTHNLPGPMNEPEAQPAEPAAPTTEEQPQ
ncbi:hypothetical protein IP91_02598 [Pseudoduganella lurida]|uniref:Uncharacterized protein n=1 Tax=Pseudoduganella lurida TaxID=1036180 RepID=A0A562R803_9BURK|nr:hypothetical protein [Pseudoduganella lurida]TWI65191.1 hypothetical protein IP91_02598 [Pseudoduganella lurida]